MIRRLAALLVLLSLGLTACSSLRPPSQPSSGADPSSARAGSPSSSAPSTLASPPAGDGSAATGSTVTCDYTPAEAPAKPVDPPPSENVANTGTVNVTLAMTEGDVSLAMDRAKAPCTINSFESLATQGFFDKTSCHRLVDSGIFVLQCGDPTGTGSGGPGYAFADELSGKETYPAGTVAMANSGPGTNGSQFFMVYDDSPLPPNYTVFATMDKQSTGIVARMAAEGQDGSSAAGGGKPNNPSEITKVTLD